MKTEEEVKKLLGEYEYAVDGRHSSVELDHLDAKIKMLRWVLE